MSTEIDLDKAVAICKGELNSSEEIGYWQAWQILIDTGKIKEMEDDMKIEAMVYINRGYIKCPD